VLLDKVKLRDWRTSWDWKFWDANKEEGGK